MIEKIYIEDSTCEKLKIKAEDHKYDIGTVFKGIALLIADMWFPGESPESPIKTWEGLFKKTQNNFEQKNTIIKNDFSCTFEYKNGVSMIMESSRNVNIQDIASSIFQMLDFLVVHEWDENIFDFLPVEQRKTRDEVNMTTTAIPFKCLHEAFFDYAGIAPEKIALEWLSTENKWEYISYISLKEKALKVATLLKMNGVKKEDCVAVILPKSERQVITILGILAIGAIYVPIGIHQPLERKKKIIESGKITNVITDSIHAAEVQQVENINISMVEESNNCQPMSDDEIVKNVESIAYIIFTSGTTGIPKGVMITHKAAYNTIYDVNEKFGVNATDCAIAVSELDFDLSVYDIFGMLGWGASLIILNEENKREPAIWKKILYEKHVSIWNSVPALFEMLLVAVGKEYKKITLKNIFLSGDWIKLEVYSTVQKLWPMCKFISLGGATEAAIWSVYFEVKGLDENWTSIPYGKPLANQYLRVVNDNGYDSPDGVPGELWIGGYGVAQGYVNEEKLTNEKFSEISGVRWYKTGDKAQYYQDGNVQFLGRLDDQVKVNGYRIELGEIENVIKKEENVDDAVAMIAEYNGKKEIVAAILPKTSKENVEFEIIVNREDIEYSEMQELRKLSVAAFILAIEGNDLNLLKADRKVELNIAGNVGEYWKSWLLANNIISLKDDNGKYTLNYDIEDIQNNALYMELKSKEQMIKEFIENNSRADILLSDSHFSPEELLVQGTDSITFLERTAANLRQKSRIAILGVRTGVAVEILLKNALNKDIEFVLIDDSIGMLKLSEERLEKYNSHFEYYHFENGLIEESYIGTFDAVIAIGTLHRYKNPLDGLNVANLLLKSNGELIMLEYEDLDPMAVISSAIIEDGFSGYSRKRNNTALLEMDEWIDIFKQSGFQKVSMERFPSSSALFVSALSNQYSGQMLQKRFEKYMEESLVSYMIPQALINFAWFPLSSNGKVDRKMIRQIIVNRKHIENKDEAYIGFEEEVVNMWKDMLGLEHIGREDGFFEVGGDSLLATRLIEEVKRKYGIEISLREVFDNPELYKLAAIIETKIDEVEQMIEGEI